MKLGFDKGDKVQISHPSVSHAYSDESIEKRLERSK